MLAGEPYEIARCLGCGFAWQTHVVGDECAGLLYSKWISSEESLDKKRFGDVSLFEKYASEAREIASLVGKRPHETDVLDFGMGWGYWCRMAAAFGYRTFGYEYSKERREHARTLGVSVLDSVAEIGSMRFDFINAEQVFEHVVDPVNVLRSLVRSLRPGGSMRIAVPNADGPLSRLERGPALPPEKALQPLEHINCFTRRTLEALGVAAGLTCLGSCEPAKQESIRSRVSLRLRGFFGRSPLQGGTGLYFRKQGGS
jgi:2-polyprenyl-3-methyl-5-hydroxy-6-metoxy-1,4-benzoquinol methylase